MPGSRYSAGVSPLPGICGPRSSFLTGDERAVDESAQEEKTVQRVRSKAVSLALLGALPFAACGRGSSSTAPSVMPTPVTLTAAPTARYSVSFDATWSAASHPSDFPSNPHFSPLIGGTHSPAVRFWRAGDRATDGIEAMSELGSVTPLDLEVQAAITARTAQHLLRGQGISRSPGTTSLEFEIERDQPLVTLVSMIAPSPDWFTGVHE